jgi:hypothetical protein
MGWVEQKIADHLRTKESIVPLWNSLRDSIGEAVTDFQLAVHTPGVSHGDCRARGRLCIRVQKPGRFIEIFLPENDQTVQSAPGVTELNGPIEDGTIQEICRYRLNKDRSGLEFFIQNDRGETEVLSADEVARRVLEPFLFVPFPTTIVRRQTT